MGQKQPQELSELLDLVVRSFRLGIEGQGSDALTRFIDTLTPLLDSQKISTSSRDIALLNEITAAQNRGDHIYIADLLQYELPASNIGKCLLPDPGSRH